MKYQNPDKYKNYWKTAISEIDRNKITIRGYPLAELSGRVSYTDAIVLCLRGELPDPVESACVNAMFTAAMDHQYLNTTALAARTVVSANPDPVAGIAAGVLSFGEVTAGVPAFVVQVIDSYYREDDDADARKAAAQKLVDDFRGRGDRIPGFGHPLHDLVETHFTFRSKLLYDRVEEAGLRMDGKIGFYLDAHSAFLAAVGKEFPINVDGIMGAVFAELGYDQLEAHALAPFAMLPGIVAHVVEEIKEGVPLRIVPDSEYVGLPERHRPEFSDQKEA
jgi:citrate synthase